MAEKKSIIFPPNITGFYNVSEGPPKPESTMLFFAKCQEAEAQGLLETVQFFDYSEEPNRSYHLQLVKDSNSIGHFIFVNKFSSLIAISKILDANWEDWDGDGELPTNQYVDHAELSQAFKPLFTSVPVKVLLLPIDADNPESAEVVQLLQDVEFAQLSFYAPQNMGNLLFNNWEK